MTKQEMTKILEENRDLIENKNFEEFYKNIKPSIRHYFTDLFLKSGINPLDYMTEVPWYYADSLNNLENIDIPNNITYIGWYAFHNCWSLKNINLPSTVIGIGSYAFYNCYNLQNLKIPKSVESIGTDVFTNCKNLSDIYYEGSYEDWSDIKINPNNEALRNIRMHFDSKI